jgi:two-component system CheB/CheR fusion protein
MNPKKIENLYVVGIGASAGGLEALEKFFDNMPADSGMAFIVVQHLSPDYRSMMVEILSKHTEMPVLQVEDGMLVQADCIYLIPRKKNMTIFHGQLFLTEKDATRGLNLPIDIFFMSLAQDQAEKAIAVILSGTGSDGTRGIRAIKENDGMIIVQEPTSAKFDGMPNSAISTNLVDYVLPPEQMPRELLKFILHPHIAKSPQAATVTKNDEDGVSKILAEIRNQLDVDFSGYKQSTVIRRIQRRMGINQLNKMSDYSRYVQQNSQEVNTLYRELLIGVTKFFRDTEAFEAVNRTLLPKIFEQNRNTFRVWVAGCSTGEEAYSIAILFAEYLQKTDRAADVKIFATDIDKSAIEYASLGLYPDSIAADISSERLHRFFIKKEDKYQIHRDIRQMVIFAKHNLVKDPPFVKIDLVTCRNLLIYLQPSLQEKVFTFFHFSLKTQGFLFLGTSETIGDNTDLFSSIDNKQRIYQYKAGYKSITQTMPSLKNDKLPDTPLAMTAKYASSKAITQKKLSDFIYQALAEEYIPPFIVINENHQVVHTGGDVGGYLKIPRGDMSFDLVKLLREDFSVILRTAVHSVLKNHKKLVYNLNLKEKTGEKHLNLHVMPLFSSPEEPHLIAILFEEIKKTVHPFVIESFDDVQGNFSQHIIDLEQELQYTRESLQAAIEELETSNEELQATNEELLAANEELQSTNEELQSVNEELMTVNTEYQYKIEELTDVNNDINNLLSSTHIGTVFLDENLCVKRFTPDIASEIYLMTFDIGRPFEHISHNLKYQRLKEDIYEVAKTRGAKEIEVESKSGKGYLLRILPYLTVDKVAQGVVVTLVDLTERRRSEESRYLLAAIAESLEEAIIGSNLEGRILSWNNGAEKLFGYEASEIQGESILRLVSPNQQTDIDKFLVKMKQGKRVEHVETVFVCREGQQIPALVTAAPIRDANGTIIGFYQIIRRAS